jgi:primosomal protein N' (replication factor Y)
MTLVDFQSTTSTLYASILVPPLTNPFTYKVSPEIADSIAKGSRVSISFGNTFRYGYVIEVTTTAPENFPLEKLKELSKATHPYPHFLPEQLPFFNWIADYYGHTLSEVLEQVVPPPVPDKKITLITHSGREAEKKLGIIGAKIVEVLKTAPNKTLTLSELQLYFRGAADAVKRLEKQGLLTRSFTDEKNSHVKEGNSSFSSKGEITLTKEQEEAVKIIGEHITNSTYGGILLHGDTGSGKTEVYLSLIEQALALGKGAIVVVPEIALTPQLVGRMRARLGGNLAVLHSALPPRERWDAWRALLDGSTSVAVGARSALFAPVKNLGLIVVDEEHDSSFKQERGVRYHARDMAIMRGHLAKAPCVLGSATPSLESYFNAKTNKITYIHLPVTHARAKRAPVEIVDLAAIKPWEMPTPTVTFKLKDAIAKAVGAGGQVFILYNRRGFSSYLQCDNCEEVISCPNCSVTLTLHAAKKTLLCHYCNHQIPPPEFCPTCLLTKPETPSVMVRRGAGTERVYDDLRTLFPTYKIDRLDRDVVSDLKSYEEKLEKVRDGTTQILVGTQMIAKGHDMPNVTLVGIVDADVGLHFPDFRASERVYQLLTQSAGRAGRGTKQGHVILQTRSAIHPSVVCTVKHDYAAFASAELTYRKELGYPPYSRIIRILITGEDKELTQKISAEIAAHAMTFSKQLPKEVIILGPAAAPLEKIKNKWRFHILCKSPSMADLSALLKKLVALKIKTKKVSVIFDRDPVDML